MATGPARFRVQLAVGVLLALGFGLATLQIASERRLNRTHVAAAPPLAPAEASLDVGRRLVEDVGHCGTCHGEDLAGARLADDFWLGRLYAANLTPGRGGLGDWSLADFARVVRQGVRRDGRSALLMPSRQYRVLRDDELASMFAYLRSLPPIDRTLPRPRVGPLARVALLTGRAPDLLAAEWAAAAPSRRRGGPAPAEREGERLIALGGCRICHAEDLKGGRHALALPGEPTPADITPSGPIASWSEREFVHALRTGITPDGRTLDPEFMPWPRIARLSDAELESIWRYLRATDRS